MIDISDFGREMACKRLVGASLGSVAKTVSWFLVGLGEGRVIKMTKQLQVPFTVLMRELGSTW